MKNNDIKIQNFDSTPYEPLYREVMGRCLAIQEALAKHDFLFDETPFEEWNGLKNRFWNEYIYPKHTKVYFELFPDDKGKKDNQDRFKGDFDILDYNKKMVIALCEWLKRDGFFHFFEGEVLFISPDPTDLAFVLTDGVSFRRYPPEYIGKLLERLAGDFIKNQKKMEKLKAWVVGLSVGVGFLLALITVLLIKK